MHTPMQGIYPYSIILYEACIKIASSVLNRFELLLIRSFLLIILLTEWLQNIMIETVLFGETGANPVRARRRKAYAKSY